MIRTQIAFLVVFLAAWPEHLFGQSRVIVEGGEPSRFVTGIPTPADQPNDDDISWLRDHDRALWSHQNVSLVHTVDVISRGTGPVSPIPYSKQNISDWNFIGVDGQCRPLIEIFKNLRTNGAIIIKGGSIVSEVYLNGFRPDKRHQMNSATKSFVGLLVGILATEGKLNLNEVFVEQFPELEEAGVADGTLNHALDMTLGIDWPMGWQETGSFRIMNFMAGGFMRPSEGFPYANTLELIASAPKEAPHGKLFAYESVNTEMLAWSISRTSGRNWQEVLSDRIWSQLGAERDAFVIVDNGGHGFATAGMSATLRDLARAALMIQNNGFYNSRQIVPESWIKETIKGNKSLRSAMQSERELAAYGNSLFYNNQFRVLDTEQGELFASGGIGQKIYVNQQHKLAAVFFAANFTRDETVFQIALIQQIRDRLASPNSHCAEPNS